MFRILWKGRTPFPFFVPIFKLTYLYISCIELQSFFLFVYAIMDIEKFKGCEILLSDISMYVGNTFLYLLLFVPIFCSLLTISLLFAKIIQGDYKDKTYIAKYKKLGWIPLALSHLLLCIVIFNLDILSLVISFTISTSSVLIVDSFIAKSEGISIFRYKNNIFTKVGIMSKILIKKRFILRGNVFSMLAKSGRYEEYKKLNANMKKLKKLLSVPKELQEIYMFLIQSKYVEDFDKMYNIIVSDSPNELRFSEENLKVFNELVSIINADLIRVIENHEDLSVESIKESLNALK